MALTAPLPGAEVDDVWVAGLTKTINGFYASGQATSSGPLSGVGSATYTDVPGVGLTFNITGANAYILAWYSADVSPAVAAGSNVLIVALTVDGAAQGGGILVDERVTRATPMRCHRISLAAGSHTVKIQALKAQAGGTFTVNSALLQVELFDLP